MDAPLQAYLEIAYNYYLDDRLELAWKVVEDASLTRGWPANTWIEFYNELQCEKDARAASEIHRADDRVSVEVMRGAPGRLVEEVESAALEARDEVGRLLGADMSIPVLVTIFLPDAPTDFISGSHGYMVPKRKLGKICLPWETLQDAGYLRESLVHEFAHVATHELGGQEVPRWLGEGLATYLCGELKGPRVRQRLAGAARSRNMLELSRLEGLLYSSDARKDNPIAVERAYLLAGSLVEFWAAKHGIGSIRDALVRIGEGSSPERAISEATQTPLDELVHQWSRTLRGA